LDKFDQQIKKALGHYVYALIDPFTDKIFYVGKASGNNRVFNHLKSSKLESEKTEKIKEIRLNKIEKGRLRLDEVKRLYGSDPIKIETIKERYMTFFINKTYSTHLSEIEIYDATRQFWTNVSKDKRTRNKQGKLDYPIALSIYDSVVIRVYSIIDWFEAGTTFSTRKTKNTNRFEFVGNIIDKHYLLGKKLINQDGTRIKANQQGYGYINNVA
jgi:hypothetical protein